jgi:peptide/nickel transport system permease protein
LIPTVTLSGLMVAGMLNGVVITETVFGINGVGLFAASSALSMDIGAVLGFTLFSGTIFIVANLIVDIIYAHLDPRIRLG